MTTVYNKNGVAFDIDVIATDLNGKADVDLTNLNDAGNIKTAHNAMPSSTYVRLTLGASGATYTAPADGYFYADGAGTANGDYRLTSDIMYKDVYTWGVINFSMLLPVIKGQVVTYTYSSTYNDNNNIYFFYAVGSESEAS